VLLATQLGFTRVLRQLLIDGRFDSSANNLAAFRLADRRRQRQTSSHAYWLLSKSKRVVDRLLLNYARTRRTLPTWMEFHTRHPQMLQFTVPCTTKAETYARRVWKHLPELPSDLTRNLILVHVMGCDYA
jgi:hypothetical protein